jgi:ATP-dependent helicase/DNAse subunit B
MAVHGKLGKLTVNSEDYTAFLKSGGLDTSNEVVDVTTLSKNSKVYIAGLNDGTIPLEGIITNAQLVKLNTARALASVAFAYGPVGDTPNTNVKYSGNCIFSSFSVSNTPNNEVVFSATLQITGDVSVGTWA